tara:strand:- start:1138 stop:1386 length:249 start_codon:yes stop_codon:yes gene_type:complete
MEFGRISSRIVPRATHGLHVFTAWCSNRGWMQQVQPWNWTPWLDAEKRAMRFDVSLCCFGIHGSLIIFLWALLVMSLMPCVQ